MKRLPFVLAALAFTMTGAAQAQSGMDIVRGRMELNLRQAGMTPEAAHWATWASEHKPYTPCAQYADRIDGMMNMPNAGDPSGYIPYTVIKIEQSGICRRNVIEKAKPSRQYLEEQRKLQKQRDEIFDSARESENDPSLCLGASLARDSEDVNSHAYVSLKCHIIKKQDGYLHAEHCSVGEKSGDSEFLGDVLQYLEEVCWKVSSPPTSLDASGIASFGFTYDPPEQ